MKASLSKKTVITINPELQTYIDSNGESCIRIRITQNKKHTRENTGFKISPDFWTGSKGNWISNNHPRARYLNNELSKKLSLYEDQYLDLMKENKIVKKEDVYYAINKQYLKKNFLAFWDNNVEGMKNYNHYKGYHTTRKKVVSYAGTDLIDFKDINMQWLKGFETYLSDNALCGSTIHSEIRKVRRTWNLAIEAKIIDRSFYPFGKDGYKIKAKEKNLKRIDRLDRPELKRFLLQWYKPNTTIHYTRLGFELAFNLSGIRVEDLLCLQWLNASNGRIGYNMAKGITGHKFMDFEITPKIDKILKQLKTTESKPTDYIIPLMKLPSLLVGTEEYKKEVSRKTSLYNKNLKQIAKDAEISKNITSHLAKHSWAAIAYEETKDILFIKEKLGHEKIETTVHYIGRLCTKESDKKTNDIMKNLY
ncbi:site-specific integrase [Aurantibacillus circumpalustris]|uniref:site-specific integrase n=1 Tax=Aurantibacillus circumpalustris TaxID=3036359 RepID=UPI00295B57E6|nr:site-specific integrase [Aurantibacillus circumpalustris]